MKNSSYVQSPFVSTFVLHSLKCIKHVPRVNAITNKAIRFLLSLMEPPGIWRFYGNKSAIPHDMDDTCCALASLSEYGVRGVDYEYLMRYLLRFRAKSGLFFVWMQEPIQKENVIDSVVNANILYYYSLHKKRLPTVSKYLRNIVDHSSFNLRSLRSFYYLSPYAFTYVFSRAYRDGGANDLANSVPIVKKQVLSRQKADGSWGNELDTAFATVTLLNTGYQGIKVHRGIHYLLCKQKYNGSWSAACFSAGPSVFDPILFYGSAEFTTAICLEALGKFIQQLPEGSFKT